MNAGVGIGLFICIVLIVIVGAVFRYYTDDRIESLDIKVNHLDIFYSSLDKSYYSLDKRCDDMFDIIKLQQEEIKILKGMNEPEKNKKCCRNCRFYYELNNQSSACLNVNVNNKHKGSSTLYAENKPITWGTIKCVEQGGICEYYEPKEDPNGHTD